MTCAIPDNVFETYLQTQSQNSGDTAHDLSHVKRVVANATRLMNQENADPKVVTPAAWLHDCVVVPKNSSKRPKASTLAAVQAVTFLKSIDYPQAHLEEIAHAVEAHSFSANITPRTIEAKVVQDADRLDAIGAIGIARCLAISGALNRPIYNENDPFCTEREPDDTHFTIDHFYKKLLTLKGTMQTQAGKKEATERTNHMVRFLEQLKSEIQEK